MGGSAEWRPSSAGKYSAEIRPTLLLTIPCLLLPCWAGLRIFAQPRDAVCCPADVVSAPQCPPQPPLSYFHSNTSCL